MLLMIPLVGCTEDKQSPTPTDSTQVRTKPNEKVPCRNYKDVFALFDRLGYTPSRPYRVLRTITSGVTFSRVSRSVIFKGSWACYQQVQNAANAVLKLRPDGSRITSKRQLS